MSNLKRVPMVRVISLAFSILKRSGKLHKEVRKGRDKVEKSTNTTFLALRYPVHKANRSPSYYFLSPSEIS